VADRHGLIFLVNGTWNAGSAGGGYPDVNKHGNALADGTFIEHHEADTFFKNYVSSSQWAAQSPITAGKAVHFAVSYGTSTTQSWASCGCVTYAATQSDYGSKPAPWGPFYNIGLPTGVA
jgi:hypothetical protein